MLFRMIRELFHARKCGRGYEAYSNKKFVEAFRLLQGPANAGMSMPQYYIGRMYMYGEGVEKNMDDATYWLEKSGVQGLDWAQYELGGIYEFQGELDKAFSWYMKAAKRGDFSAQAKVGGFYLVGEVVDKDDSVAIDWLEKSSAGGNESALKILEQINLKK